MSWSFNATGKPAAVLAKMKADLARNKCVEPEETIKNGVLDIVDKALSAFPAGSPVEVSACGSQSTDATGAAANQLTVNIKPLWGFLE
jgi:hypothetical protein